jgi:hypothetical protein
MKKNAMSKASAVRNICNKLCLPNLAHDKTNRGTGPRTLAHELLLFDCAVERKNPVLKWWRCMNSMLGNSMQMGGTRDRSPLEWSRAIAEPFQRT